MKIPLRQPSLPEVRIELKGMIPPSVNHYVKHTRSGHHYKTQTAKDFAITLAVLSKGSVDAEQLCLEVWIYLGAKQKGDGDNFFKVVADSLVDALIIKSDAHVVDWHLYKRRDRENPRTEIRISALPSLSDRLCGIRASAGVDYALPATVPYMGIKRSEHGAKATCHHKS